MNLPSPSIYFISPKPSQNTFTVFQSVGNIEYRSYFSWITPFSDSSLCTQYHIKYGSSGSFYNFRYLNSHMSLSAKYFNQKFIQNSKLILKKLSQSQISNSATLQFRWLRKLIFWEWFASEATEWDRWRGTEQYVYKFVTNHNKLATYL